MTASPLDDGLMHDGNTGVTCPTCGGTTNTADSFCESCGTELAPPLSSADPPGYTAQCPVCSLDESAPPGPISTEGYCESCGRKVPSGRDHVELNLELLAGVTDRGLRHPRNEDAMALATTETPEGPVVVAVVCDGSMPTERTVLATLGTLGARLEEEAVKPPAIIVIGEVVRVAHPDAF